MYRCVWQCNETTVPAHSHYCCHTLHHHWPQICSLYHVITVHCVQLCLSLYCVPTGCWRIHHFSCSHSLHSLCVAWARAPAPRKSGQCPCNINQTHAQLCGCWLDRTCILWKRQCSFLAFLSVNMPSKYQLHGQQKGERKWDMSINKNGSCSNKNWPF